MQRCGQGFKQASQLQAPCSCDQPIRNQTRNRPSPSRTQPHLPEPLGRLRSEVAECQVDVLQRLAAPQRLGYRDAAGLPEIRPRQVELPQRPVVADASGQRHARLPPLALAAPAAREALCCCSAAAALRRAGAGEAAGGRVKLGERRRGGQQPRERGAAAGVEGAALQLDAREGGAGQEGAGQEGGVAAAWRFFFGGKGASDA
jgi:hypothetical protein